MRIVCQVIFNRARQTIQHLMRSIMKRRDDRELNSDGAVYAQLVCGKAKRLLGEIEHMLDTLSGFFFVCMVAFRHFYFTLPGQRQRYVATSSRRRHARPNVLSSGLWGLVV